MPDIKHYQGREQGYIKHALIERYLEPFTIKIGSKWDEIVFIDAFAGPWGAQSDDLSDTSFGIALERLARGLQVLRDVHKRSPRIRAYLIEKTPEAFRKLDAFGQRHQAKGIDVECLSGEFEDHVPILERLTRAERTFLFSLIDPKGWTGLSMAVIAPLIRRRSSEVLVNVMSSFVHRFADVDHCQESYDDYFGRPGVREIITSAAHEDRQDVVVREYCRSLRHLCGYQHVSSCVILEPDKKGIKYFMVFATNDPMGIKVFKEAEAHAAALQDEMKHAKEFGDQMPLFSAGSVVRVSESLRRKYRMLAFARVDELFQKRAMVPYVEVFCKAMAMPLVTENELLEYLRSHQSLTVSLESSRRLKPSIQKNDTVVKI
ncbi:MAG: three-Cys-motif partner protein TcmP [Verrucomicrobia bacterium]|nr:three-Cys-motif partner protein TcmP [Verrucomicrobiota bacterium]